MIARKNSLLRQFLLAVTLGGGFGTLWFVLALWLGTSTLRAWPGRNRPPLENLVVKSDGTPLIVSTSPENLMLATYRDMDGRVYDAVGRNERSPMMYMTNAIEAFRGFSAQSSWKDRIRVFLDEREPTANWYFVHDGKSEGAGYFVGYESESNRRIGFIGLSGFRAHSVPTDEWIPVRGELVMGYSLWSSVPYSIHSGRVSMLRPDRWDLPPRLVYVPSGNRLRLVDLAARTIATVFETPEPIEAVGVPTLSSYSEGQLTRERPIRVRTRQKVYALDHKHHVISEFVIPTEIDRQSPVYWYDFGNGQAIADFVRPLTPGKADDENVHKRIVYRVADDGAIRDTFEFVLRTGSPLETKQTRDFLQALGIPVPAGLLLVEPSFVMMTDPTQGFTTAFIALLKRSWTSLVAVLILSSVLAMFAWRWSRAFGLSPREQKTWAIFVLLLGFPAYVGFRLSRRWPNREACPNCHALGALDRADCASCGTRFPDPSLKGIEIFA